MTIDDIKYTKVDGKTNNSFVGIKVSNNEIEFCYPETYVLSDDIVQKRKDIILLLKTLSLAKSHSSGQSTLFVDNVNNYNLPLMSFLWLINDYLIYGSYPNYVDVSAKSSQGRINWKKTLRSNPIISRGNIVYTDFVSNRRAKTSDILSDIYFCCIKKSLDAIGWIYNLSFERRDKDYDLMFDNYKDYYLKIIYDRLKYTFDDIGKERLTHMKNIFIGLDENNTRTNNLYYGVDPYNYVFERMIDSMFSNVDDHTDYLPSGTWNLIIDNQIYDSSHLYPDTINIQKKNVYILDAKNYRYGETFSPSDLPNTESIQKQITYGDYIKNNHKKFNKIYNAFLIPYSKDNNIYNKSFNKKFEFFGTATAKWSHSKKQTQKTIVGILIDMNYLIYNWNNKNDDDINEIIAMIEKNVNKKS